MAQNISSSGHSEAPGLCIGTCGYSYGEWVDAGFYPPGTHSAGMLDSYAQRFSAVELNYTWYQMPAAGAMERMCQKLPEHFRIAAKLTRTLTHEIKKDLWTKQALLFRQGIEPLARQGCLLAILVQLPPSFTRTIPHRSYLAALLDELSGLPLAVEFRHDSWAVDSVFSELARRNVALACVDCPEIPGLFPRLARVTSPDLFYLRFHGRNARGWNSGSMQQQFNYHYSHTELARWADIIRTQLLPHARQGALFFNNHVRGQAPANALHLAELLGHPVISSKN